MYAFQENSEKYDWYRNDRESYSKIITNFQTYKQSSYTEYYSDDSHNDRRNKDEKYNFSDHIFRVKYCVLLFLPHHPLE